MAKTKPSKTASRRQAAKTQRTPRRRPDLYTLSFGEMDEETGAIWAPFEVWLRTACDYYLQYPEVYVPELDADGQPVLDSWGRPRETAPDQHTLGMKPGAVWMTRQMFQLAWLETFKQRRNADDFPEIEEERQARLEQRFNEKVATIAKERQISLKDAAKEAGDSIRVTKEGDISVRSTNPAHPMDTLFRKLVKSGRIHFHGQRRYMIDRDYLEHLDKLKVWTAHMDRGERWEGLYYEDVFEGRVRTVHRPLSAFASYASPRVRAWKMGILHKLRQHLIFDSHTVRMLAEEEGLLEDSKNPDALISQHIKNWKARGEIEQVAPRLFRTTAAFTPDHKFFVPKIPHMSDWFWAFCLHWSKEQIADPDAFFDIDKILLDLHSTPEWVDEHLADGLSRPTISSRLSQYRGKHLVNHLQGSRYQLSEDLLDIFRPLHQSPVNVKSAALQVIDFFTEQSGLRERWWFRREDIRVHFPEYGHRAGAIIGTLQRSGLIEFYRNYDEGDRSDIPDTLWLPTEKAGQRLGRDTSYWLSPEELTLDQNDRPVRLAVKKREVK